MVRAGFGKVDITPYVGCPLTGYAARKSASIGIHDRLYARVLVVEGAETVAIVAADVASFPAEFVERVRALVTDRIGLPPTHVMMATSHNHSGPAIHRGYQGLAAACYVDTLALDIAGGIEAAWREREESTIGIGCGRIEGIGVNRRHADGPVDPEVGVIKVSSIGGEVKGVLFNYTCHAVVLGPDNLLITADYPGYTQRIVERQLGGGAVALFTNGAAGNINTGHSADLSALGAAIPGRTFERAERLGTALAWEVLKVAQLLDGTDELAVAAKAATVPLPQKPLPSLDVAIEDARNKERILKDVQQRGVEGDELAKATLDELYARLLTGQVRERTETGTLEGPLPVELQAIRLGECGLVSFPGEAFVEIGFGVKRRSRFAPTFFVGYTNGAVGYLPTAEAIDEGGYEGTQTRFTSQAAKDMEDGAVDLLNGLYARSRATS